LISTPKTKIVRFSASLFILLLFTNIALADKTWVVSNQAMKAWFQALGFQKVVAILPPGSDPHHYQLTAKDLVRWQNLERIYVQSYYLEKHFIENIKKQWPKIKVVDVSERLFVASQAHYLANLGILQRLSEEIARQEKKDISAFLKKLNHWKGKHLPKLAGKKIAVFHSSMDSFAADKDIEILLRVEKQHGVFPGIQHLMSVKDRIDKENVKCLLVDQHTSEQQLNKFLQVVGKVKVHRYYGDIDGKKFNNLWDWLDHLSQSVLQCSI